MNNRKESQITLRLREMKKRKWQVMLLFCLSILVAAGVAGVFRLPAITKTYQVRELTCTAVPPKGEACADFFVHVHNDDCFDGDGNLVCPLPEIKPHRHTEDCYTTSRVQVCGLPESDGHQHTADCYTSVRGDMICELSTEPILDEEGNVLEEGHVHTDECYEWHDELTCDMEEGQGAHHHNDRCFVTETTLTCDKPEIFLHTHTDDCYLKNEDGNLYVDENGNNRLVCDQIQVLQHVHGPECFTIRELDDESDETDPESNASGQFVFLYEESEEETEDGTDWTEPDEAGENPEVLEEAAQTDEENGEPAEETTDEETDKETGEETEQADGKTEESSSEEPLSIRMPAQSFEESTDTVRVRVAAPDGAFPPETTMRVTQVEIESVMDVVQESVGGEITRVQAVDISFFDADGNEIEPMVPIHVDMIPVTDSGNDETEETAATPDGSVQTILHLDNNGNTTVVEQKDGESTENSAVSFAADSFSVYILVYSNTLEKTVLASDGETYRITLSYDADARIPADAELAVEEILPDSEEYKTYLQMAENSVENEMVSFARFFDITILSGGQEIQPAAPVDVKIELADTLEEGAKAIHFGEEVEVIDAEVTSLPQKTTDAGTAENAGSETAFSADGFSVYGVIVTTLEKTITAADGNTYSVSVTYGADAKIPVDAVLSVEEILRESERYNEYVNETETVLGLEAGSLPYARFFDITILGAAGEKLQPAEGTTVAVSVQLLDRENADTAAQVLHFGEEETEILTNTVEGDTVAFEASSFSVYAIVDAPDPVHLNPEKLGSVDDIEEGTSYLLSYGNPEKYFTASLNTGGCLIENSDFHEAAVWYFEKGEDNYYKIYTVIDGQIKYIKQTNAGANNITLDSIGTAFYLEAETDNKFTFKHSSENRWLQHSNGGGGIRFYTDKNNATNARIFITKAETMVLPDDPYNLNGTTVGIVYDSESLFCTALMQNSTGNITAEDMVKLDTKGYEDKLFVPVDSDLTEWTFENKGEDRYYIKTNDGKYLTIEGGSVHLSGEPTEIRVVPGTGANKGNYSFTAVETGCKLAMTGDETNRAFTGVADGNGKIWFKFANKSNLSEDDYLVYSAKKISVSDPADEVVLYTRVWNETKSQYEFYVVNYDGSLIRCYDEGDVIQWVGNQFQTASWKLTEHTKLNDQGNLVPNGYYELKNTYSDMYIQPQLEGNSLFSDGESYLNLDGRYFLEDYTKIKCWDDTYYSYIGLKVDLENNRVVPCPSAQSDDFYFARIKNSQVHLTEVATVDNNEFGITMKMIDFNNKIVNDRDSVQTDYFGRDSDKTGLLSTDIKRNGYPDTTHKQDQPSLGALFAGDYEVNHLFIQSVYEESGYFEYDSTKNYAYLNPTDNNFEVYDQLGTVERNDTDTSYHGQFMPYNSLINPATGEPWPYSDMFTNTTTVTADPLPEDDSRYGEGLHEIPKSVADYFFGMEMKADFTQTASGLDAWGHDIVFEFSGDDDFWFYVDGELVLDLGGVHRAKTGSVNFRTGQVIGRDGARSTLREIFENNYKTRNPNATSEEVNNYLNRFFEEGSTVFRDFSTHTMKIFYMERGAGASNLHMRFNLTAVEPGKVTLTKKVTGSDDIDYSLMEFPYQILYQKQTDIDPAGEHSTWQMLAQNETDPIVTHQGSKRPVKFAESFTPVGETKAYSNVFFLKPGETASINMPDDVVDYKIVECGVNMNIFKSVKANNETLSAEEDTGRHDYETSESTVELRPQVEFENEVDPDSLRTLTITKVLWDEQGKEGGHKLFGYEDDETIFGFRVFMSLPGSTEHVAANRKYLIKNPNGSYCKWDASIERFVSLGIFDYKVLASSLEGLSDLERASIIFETSPSGGVSKIPAGYSVEFRGLPVDSSFRVIEDDIPEGYTLIDYERDQGSYISEDEPNQGTIRANEDPHVLVNNKRGWGLTLEKVWSDADFMASHDDIYFAVYVKETSGQFELLPGSVRKLSSPSTSIYYYFDELQTGASFEDYEVREVKLTNPGADENGNLTYDSIEPIETNGTLTVGGKPKNKEYQEGFTYVVTYTTGTPSGGSENVKNVRKDTVTNTRKGIKLVKTDWIGSPLPGSVFTLTDDQETSVGADSFTSDQNGLITIAYLDPGTEYKLKETHAPGGFQEPSSPWMITVQNNGSIVVSGDEDSYHVAPATEDQMAVITVKNKGFSLRALKENTDHDPLSGGVFALYRQVEVVSGLVRDQNPMSGYEALTTGTDGVIPQITSALPVGVYYLSEVTPPDGYKKLPGDLVFTVSSGGVVSIPNQVDSGDPESLIILNNQEDLAVTNWISSSDDNGNVAYTIRVPNELAGVPVSIVKVDQLGTALEGAGFKLEGEGITDGENLISEKEEGKTDAVIYQNPALPIGTYTLTETDTPDGYIPPEAPTIIEVQNTENGIVVTATVAGQALDASKVIRDTGTGEWTIIITNSAGYELPASGGSGTTLFTAIGAILSGTAGAILTLKMRKEYA